MEKVNELVPNSPCAVMAGCGGWGWGQEAITERISVAALGCSRTLQLNKGNFATLDLPSEGGFRMCCYSMICFIKHSDLLWREAVPKKA